MLWRFAACHIFWPLSTCFDHRVIESKQNYRWESWSENSQQYCLGVAWNPLCVWCKTTSGETFQSLNRTWNYRLYLLCFWRKFQSIVFDITLTCISLNNFKRNKSSINTFRTIYFQFQNKTLKCIIRHEPRVEKGEWAEKGLFEVIAVVQIEFRTLDLVG